MTTHTAVADVSSTTLWGPQVITVACSSGTRVTVGADAGSEWHQNAVAAIAGHIQTATE